MYYRQVYRYPAWVFFPFSFKLLACTNWRSTFYHHPFPGKTLEFVGFRCTLFNHVHLLEFYDGDGVVLVKYKHVKYFRSAKQYQLKRWEGYLDLRIKTSKLCVLGVARVCVCVWCGVVWGGVAYIVISMRNIAGGHAMIWVF